MSKFAGISQNHSSAHHDRTEADTENDNQGQPFGNPTGGNSGQEGNDDGRTRYQAAGNSKEQKIPTAVFLLLGLGDSDCRMCMRELRSLTRIYTIRGGSINEAISSF